MVRIVLDIQDMPEHQCGGLFRLCRQQFLAVAEAVTVGHALYRIVAQSIARLELGAFRGLGTDFLHSLPEESVLHPHGPLSFVEIDSRMP